MSQKIESILFLLMTQSKNPPHPFCHHPSRQKKITYFPYIVFFENLFPPQKNEEGQETTREKKNDQKYTFEIIGDKF